MCICTFKRARLLKKLLDELVGQRTDGLFTYSVVVADNDSAESARKMVTDYAAAQSFKVIYCLQPEQNIALSRNRALEQAEGDFAAFIDDDEYPMNDWLLGLYSICQEKKCAGVLGPVRPYFDQKPPRWVESGRFFERPEHPTGFVMDWEECRTGNVLFRRSIIKDLAEPFDPKFGTGGEDKDFFMRMSRDGCVFVWCN